LIAYATGDNNVADDNARGGNGLFTSYLIEALREPGLGLEQVFKQVKESVYMASQKRQNPYTYSNIVGEFYFRPAGATTIPLTEAEVVYWQSIKDSNDPTLFEAYRRRYPEGKFVEIADAKLRTARQSVPGAEENPSPGAPTSSQFNAGPISIQRDHLSEGVATGSVAVDATVPPEPRPPRFDSETHERTALNRKQFPVTGIADRTGAPSVGWFWTLIVGGDYYFLRLSALHSSSITSGARYSVQGRLAGTTSINERTYTIIDVTGLTPQ
jgi:hypothetical protein